MILQKLLDVFPTIKSLKIVRSALWILGEYCTDKQHILHFMEELDRCMGQYPIVEAEIKKAAGEEEEKAAEEEKSEEPKKKSSGARVTADGTYVTQSALVPSAGATKKAEENRPSIRGFLLDGEFFIAAVLATTLTKIALRYATQETNVSHQNLFVAKCMLIMASCLHLGQSGYAKSQISADDSDRIQTCIRILADSTPVMNEIFGGECRKALQQLLALRSMTEAEQKEEAKAKRKEKAGKAAKRKEKAAKAAAKSSASSAGPIWGDDDAPPLSSSAGPKPSAKKKAPAGVWGK